MSANLGLYCKKRAQSYFSQVSAETLMEPLVACSFHGISRKEAKQNPGNLVNLSIWLLLPWSKCKALNGIAEICKFSMLNGKLSEKWENKMQAKGLLSDLEYNNITIFPHLKLSGEFCAEDP